MKTFLVSMAIVIFLAGLALTAIPVDAQLGFPATLTPLPTFDYVYDSPEQAALSQNITNIVWWENAPLVIGNPKPGFVLFIIQMWRWVNDMTQQIAMYAIVFFVVVFIVLRLANRFRGFGEKSDGASISGGDVKQTVDSSDVEKFMNRKR